MKVNPDPNIVVQQSWVNVGKMKQVNWDYSARAKATELSEYCMTLMEPIEPKKHKRRLGDLREAVCILNTHNQPHSFFSAHCLLFRNKNANVFLVSASCLPAAKYQTGTKRKDICSKGKWADKIPGRQLSVLSVFCPLLIFLCFLKSP